jgi:hypothetical protein
MKKILLLIPAILLCLSVCGKAQQYWERIYPGFTREDVSNGSCQLSDGNFILVGYANTPYKKLKLLKIKLNGDTLWSKVYGNDDEDFTGYSPIAKSDGTFIITGSSDSGVFLMKYDLDGNRLWNKNYESLIDFRATEIIEAPNNGYLIKGIDFFSLVDSSFNLVWTKFATGANERYQRMCKVDNNHFAIVGFELVSSIVRPFIFKYNFSNNLVWKKYTDSLKSIPYSVKYVNNVYHIWGFNGIATIDSTKFNLGRLNSDGDFLFSKAIKYKQRESIEGVFDVLSNGNYIASTYKSDMTLADTTKCIIRIFTSNGSLLMTKEIKNFFTGVNIFSNMIELEGGEYLFTGYYQRAWGTHNTEFYAVRTDSNLFFKPTGIVNQNIFVEDFILHQNYPNPFNPSTKISYSLKKSSAIELKLFDINGRMIKIIERGFKPAGSYEIIFSAEGLSSGVYFFSLYSEGILMDTKKAVVMK